ncbi:aromatic-ring hydroxylase C-terminal domain-containing protein [Streptomyces griseoluteus]
MIPDEGAGVLGALIRPDGVVVWATDTPDAQGLDEALSRWAG